MRWGEFLLSELFDVSLPSGDIQADKCDDGKFALLSAGFNNNGICKFITCYDEKASLYNGNVISVDMFGKPFFHGYSFYAVSHGRVNILTPGRAMNKYHLQFIVTAISYSVKGKFSYNQMCSSKRVKRLIVQLPIDESGQPDYAFMERYIRAHEQRLIREYIAYLEERVKSADAVSLDVKQWRRFRIGELFTLAMGKAKGANHLENDDNGISYLGATNRNNAVLDFVKPEEGLVQKGNCIAFIRNGEGSIGYSVYKAEDFIATADITAGYAPFIDKYTGMFITTVADKVRGTYSYNYKRNEERLKNEMIQLPVTDSGLPDWQFMHDFMLAHELSLILDYLKAKTAIS